MKLNQLLALAGCLSAGWGLSSVHGGLREGLRQPTDERYAAAQEQVASGLVTLYAHDDLLSSFDFRQGVAGGRVLRGEIDLSQAQLAFGMFAEDQLSYGFVANEAVHIIDMGDIFVPGYESAGDLAPKFAPSVFHTLVLDGTKVSYRGAGDRLLRLKEAQRIYDHPPSEGLHHLQPRLGHTYLVRVVTRGNVEELFKFQVIDFLPGHSLSLRWAQVGRL